METYVKHSGLHMHTCAELCAHTHTHTRAHMHSVLTPPHLTCVPQLTDCTEKAISEMVTKTQEFLHPNPATRAKLAASASLYKLRGQASSKKYPHPEINLANVMQQNGEDLAGENGEDSVFGSAMIDFAQSMRDLADVKDELVSACVYACMYVRRYVRMYVRTYVRMYVCITYLCMYGYMYIYVLYACMCMCTNTNNLWIMVGCSKKSLPL